MVNTLAVIAKCAEPDGIVARVNENDGPVTQDDSFQVYLSTSGSSYTEFAINPAGYLLDTKGFAGGERLSHPGDWTSGARVAVHRAEWILAGSDRHSTRARRRGIRRNVDTIGMADPAHTFPARARWRTATIECLTGNRE